MQEFIKEHSGVIISVVCVLLITAIFIGSNHYTGKTLIESVGEGIDTEEVGNKEYENIKKVESAIDDITFTAKNTDFDLRVNKKYCILDLITNTDKIHDLAVKKVYNGLNKDITKENKLIYDEATKNITFKEMTKQKSM